jgi:hypothetical protein
MRNWDLNPFTLQNLQNQLSLVASFPLYDSILVEIECIMSVVTQLYFQIVEENNYMFRPFSWWAIIKLRLEYCSIWVFSDILVSTWWWTTQKKAKTCSCFLQQFENTVVLRRTFIHLISSSKTNCQSTFIIHYTGICVFPTDYVLGLYN